MATVRVTSGTLRRARTATREKRFAICVQNQGAEDLDLRKVYRVLPDKVAEAEGHLRVIDESGDDYLYPSDYFVFVELPQKAKRAWAAVRGRGGRRLRPTGSRTLA